jgi:hypothetical protein
MTELAHISTFPAIQELESLDEIQESVRFVEGLFLQIRHGLEFKFRRYLSLETYPDRDKTIDKIVDLEFFREHMLPTILRMAEGDPERVRAIGDKACLAYAHLNIPSAVSPHREVDLSASVAFFSTEEPSELLVVGDQTEALRGQFQYFYDYGDEFPIVAAMHHGILLGSTMGTGDRETSKPEVETKRMLMNTREMDGLLGVYVEIFGKNEERSNRGFMVAAQYYLLRARAKCLDAEISPKYDLIANLFGPVESLDEVVKFLQGCPDVIAHFMEEEPAPDGLDQDGDDTKWKGVIDPYALIIAAAPVFEGVDATFPALDAPEALREMNAFNELFPDRVALSRFAQLIIRYDHKRPSFLDPADLTDAERLQYFDKRVDVREIILDLREAEYSDQDIADLLNLVTLKAEEIGYVALDIAKNYPSIDRNYPGGGDAFIAYLLEIHEYDGLQVNSEDLIREFSKSPEECAMLNYENLPDYLRVGRNTVNYLGSYATPYWEIHKIAPRLAALVDDDPEEFEEVISGAVGFVFEFTLLPIDPETIIKLFSYYLRHWGDPRFEDYIEGLQLIHARLHHYKNEPWEPKKANIPDEIGSAYLGLPFRMRQETDPDPDLYKSFDLPDLDYRQFGTLLSLLCVNVYDEESASPDYAGFTLPVVHGEDPVLVAARLLWGEDDPEGEFTRKLADISVRIAAMTKEIENFDISEPLGKIQALLDRAREETGIKSLSLLDMAQEADPDRKLLGPATPDPIVLPGDKPSDYPVVDSPRAAMAISLLRHRHNISERLLLWRKSMLFFPQPKRPQETGLVDVDQLIQNPMQWLEQTSSTTQLGAITGSLFMALGLNQTLVDFPELEDAVPAGLVQPLPIDEEIARLSRGEGTVDDILQKIKDENLFSHLMSNMLAVRPHVARLMLAERIKMPGLLAVGSKVRTSKDMTFEDFDFILKLAGLGDVRNTPFRLKHQGKVLVNPASPDAFTQRMLILLYSMMGVMTGKDPNIQSTITGRLPNELAGIVGASVLLATYTGTTYEDGAFDNTQQLLTGNRIMLCDAGVLDTRMPYHLNNARGRLDMNGHFDSANIDLHQVVGTGAAHLQYEGAFKPFMERYRKRFLALLETYRLGSALDMASWVFHINETNDPPLYHEQMIRVFTDAWHAYPDLRQKVRALIQEELIDPIFGMRSEMILRHPDQFRAQVCY